MELCARVGTAPERRFSDCHFFPRCVLTRTLTLALFAKNAYSGRSFVMNLAGNSSCAQVRKHSRSKALEGTDGVPLVESAPLSMTPL